MAEVVAAIHTAQGDSRGMWCDSVAQYRGRLVAYRDAPVNQTPMLNVFLDLNNLTAGDSAVLFDLGRATITWTVTDENGKEIAPNALAGTRAKEPMDQKIFLKPYGNARLPMSQTDGNAAGNGGGYLTLAPGVAWSFDRNDKMNYLSRL